MTQKSESSAHSPKPWYWGLAPTTHQSADGSYAKALDEIYINLQNGSGKPPSDSRMDLCACNLALAMKKIKT